MNLELRKKYSFRVGGHRIVLVKKSFESDFHVLAKALVYALYLEDYPGLTIEKVIQDRYKPDVVAFDDDERLIFWAECGAVKPDKIAKLLHKFRQAHFVFVKKPSQVDPFRQILAKIIRKLKYSVRVELIAFPDNFEEFVDDKGNITICPVDCQVETIGDKSV